jgi:DMSO/TMAO reductase YedYZ molybdopterin-dependent catalytic subunit
MRNPSLRTGAVLALVTTPPVIALLYLGSQAARLPYFPFRLFDWLARVLPGDVITAGIDVLVTLVGLLNLGPTDRVAKSIEQAMALALFATLLMLTGMLVAWLARQEGQGTTRLAATAALPLLLLAALVEASLGFQVSPVLSLAWLALVVVGWGAVVAHVLRVRLSTGRQGEGDTGRRAFVLRLMGSTTAITFGAWGLGRLLGAGARQTGAGVPLADQPAVQGAADLGGQATAPSASVGADGRLSPAPGTRPELTPDGAFYRIDINTIPPTVDGSTWRLEARGLFERPRAMSLEDLMAFPAHTQPITLSCISNRVGGDLIGTANWSGARLRDVLAELGLLPEAQALFVESTDGFYESVTMADMLDSRTLLVYGMNGETLPVRHGFPLRIYIPNRYGMKQPKWITSITAIDDEGRGYWVDRGWSKEARPQIVSVIDTVAADQLGEQPLLPIGGIAWAGDRGIRRVEVQIDGGDWLETELRDPPLSPLTWVQWRVDWQPVPGSHDVRVRAVDGTGAMQIEEERGSHPDGATGYHSRRFRV